MSEGTKVMWHKRKHVKPRVSSVFRQPVYDQKLNSITEDQKASINAVGICIFLTCGWPCIVVQCGIRNQLDAT